MDSKKLTDLAAKVEEASALHKEAVTARDTASRRETETSNRLRDARKNFDEALDEFKNSHSDSHNHRWGPKFQRSGKREDAR